MKQAQRIDKDTPPNFNESLQEYAARCGETPSDAHARWSDALTAQAAEWTKVGWHRWRDGTWHNAPEIGVRDTGN